MDTRTWSSRSPARSGSSAGEPMVKLPAGTTTISGQSAQSLKRSPAPGMRQRRSPAPSAVSMSSQRWAAAGPIASTANPKTTANLVDISTCDTSPALRVILALAQNPEPIGANAGAHPHTTICLAIQILHNQRRLATSTVPLADNQQARLDCAVGLYNSPGAAKASGILDDFIRAEVRRRLRARKRALRRRRSR